MKRTNTGAWMLGMVLAAALSGCGDDGKERACGSGSGDNSLDGSYCEGIEMLFNEVRVRVQEAGRSRFLSVEYVRPMGEGLEKTLAILFDVSQIQVAPGVPIFFLESSGSVRRVLQAGIQTLTQELEPSSNLTLDVYSGEVGSRVEGSFAFRFTNGRTLLGSFSGRLEIAHSGG